nr:MAG TPA: NUMOD4 motif protein [Caudoviricetes sp.]
MWKDVKGYENLYEVNENGIIRSIPHLRKNGVNGCPSSYDYGAVSKDKEKECILCKFHCISAKDELFNKEYEKKSKECWKEYFLVEGNYGKKTNS